MGHHRSRRDFLRWLSLGAAVAGRPGLAEGWAGSRERKLGVTLRGLGRYSTGQLGPALRETRRCRLAGVVTGSPEKAAQWARDYGLPPTALYGYEDFDRIADNREIDIVYVVTPPALHPEFTIRAARAGKHVLCEKPMDDFADGILTGRKTRVPGEMGRRDMQIITAVYEAARTGRRTLVR